MNRREPGSRQCRKNAEGYLLAEGCAMMTGDDGKFLKR
jgi:hypothetical protein